jgi:putative zinc finger/helix-turn-helix YgiT family protein
MKPLNERNRRELVQALQIPECPDCESKDSRVQEQEHSFRYGSGVSAVELTCQVPVFICNQCGCEWTGSQAEDARQSVICHHLGRLTPGEVKSVRERYHLSQAEFSRITGFGEASLSRWETGAQIQNAASDRLLRLIDADEGNLYRLQHMADLHASSNRTFRVITITQELRQRQSAFRLRRVG